MDIQTAKFQGLTVLPMTIMLKNKIQGFCMDYGKPGKIHKILQYNSSNYKLVY